MAKARKVIITCAVTGSIHTPSMSPHLPVTSQEIADAAIGAAEAGAAIVHLHARNPQDGRPDQTPEAFAPFLKVIKQRSNVVVNITTGGAPTMSIEERVKLLEEVAAPFGNVEVMAFTGLAVQFVRGLGAGVMLRGLRTLSDMEYEFTMSLMNLNLDPGVETVFLMAKEEFSHVSSSLLRQIAALGGDLSKFLPDPVKGPLVRRARGS